MRRHHIAAILAAILIAGLATLVSTEASTAALTTAEPPTTVSADNSTLDANSTELVQDGDANSTVAGMADANSTVASVSEAADAENGTVAEYAVTTDQQTRAAATTKTAPKATPAPTPAPEEDDGGDMNMYIGLAAGFGCFFGLCVLLCVLWGVCCGKFCGDNKAKVGPMDFRAIGGALAEKDSDSTNSRRQLTDNPGDGDFR